VQWQIQNLKIRGRRDIWVSVRGCKLREFLESSHKSD